MRVDVVTKGEGIDGGDGGSSGDDGARREGGGGDSDSEGTQRPEFDEVAVEVWTRRAEAELVLDLG